MTSNKRLEVVLTYLEEQHKKPLSKIKMGAMSSKVVEEICKLTKVFTNMDYSFLNPELVEAMYKTKSNIYVYLDYSDVSIYYDVDEFNEVEFFINRLRKLNNGTNNNTTT